MKCPFCGKEMCPGALELSMTSQGMVKDAMRWVPPAQEEKSAGAGEQNLLGRMLRAGRAPWDFDRAVPLKAQFGPRGIGDLLIRGRDFLENAWYCPDCGRALCLFEREEEPGPDYSVSTEELYDALERARQPSRPTAQNEESVEQNDPWERKRASARKKKEKKPPWEG